MIDITNKINWEKVGDLIPCIVQDDSTSKVLMMGYMNRASIVETLDKRQLVFYSRSRQKLWHKGEQSGNFLHLVDWSLDCDSDTILAKVNPQGPTCHTGADTCWNEPNIPSDFLTYLQSIIHERKSNPTSKSYTSELFAKGINKVAQKVGEEAVELVIESKDDNPDLFLNEAADLMYHYLVLLSAKNFDLDDVINILKSRHN